MRLVVATGNPGKVVEIRAILESLGEGAIELRRLEPEDAVVFPDEGLDYEANAVAKARAVAEQLGAAAVADDSGIEVDALRGAPGPLSARYGGDELDDLGRVAKLLAALAGVAPGERGARFVCVSALATPEGKVVTARGECAGRILDAPRGEGGFGYDPVFQPQGFSESMAQLPDDEKNRISHRGRAFRALMTRELVTLLAQTSSRALRSST
ncbi:MAG: RdgB/HAM1 family non-canonical purine NTP pyrophosphatase [Deltaproteobacteria bacterium]|nr:RdgB/HAM1 family non-canonical purine NTP pyrophosphatase [Deltaproteobacteria bacterium]